MKKRLIAILTILGGLVGVAFAQSINGLYPTSIGVDGSNTTAVKVITLPQVQPTMQQNASPTPSALATQTPQVSNWLQLNGNGAILVEASSNTFTGNLLVQVSNNPTPVSTPGTNIYTVVADASSYASGAEPTETKNWSYYIREGWKYIRFVVQQETTNTGTLNLQARLFGNPISGDASRSYTSGVPWKAEDNLVQNGVYTAAQTVYYDYKVPQGAHGLNLFTQVLGVSGASTITTSIWAKDPYSAQLQELAVNTATHAAQVNTMTVSPGYAAPYPVATPPTGNFYFSLPVGQDIVIENLMGGTGSTTITQSVSPIQ